MKILNVSTLSGIPIFYHIKDSNGNHSPKRKITSFRFHRNALPIYVSISNNRNFRTWAHFGRPAKRRNSLRNKLLKDKQVRLNENLTVPKSDTQNLPSRFSDIDSVEKNLNNNGKEEIEAAKEVFDHNGFESVENEKSILLDESVLMDKLENWVDQYKKDAENWGIGSYPIFTVHQDSSGNVKQVSVDEGEILRRSQVQPDEIEEFPEVNCKILSAKRLAREMENGNNVIPKNSSVAKFVVQSKETGFVNTIRGFTSQPDLLPKISRIGGGVLCVFVFMWAVKELFAFKNKETRYTEMEKEMMRRKMKSRKEKEMPLNGSVDVILEASEPPMLHIEKPKLDKEKLKNNIMKAKASADKTLVGNSSFKATATSTDMTRRVQEIRDMARKAREIEGKIHSSGSSGGEMDIGETSVESEGVYKLSEEDTSSSKHQNDVLGKPLDINATLQTPCTEVTEIIDNSFPHEVVLADGFNQEASHVTDSNDKKSNKQRTELSQSTVQPKKEEVSQLTDTTVDDSWMTKESFTNNKPLVIRSVSEAKDYLSKKHDRQEVGTESRMQMINDNMDDLRSPNGIDYRSQESLLLEMNTVVPRNSDLVGISDLKPSINAGEDSDQKDEEFGILKNDHVKETEVEREVGDPQNFETSLEREVNGVNTEANVSAKTENWLEKNFDEVEPVIKKIRAGFRDNYAAAKERVDQPLDITTEMEPLEDGGELDWMQNERLRDIVFKVRDNELAGHEPFHLIDDKDREAFFRGLEKKVEEENKKLSYLHEWLHSNIENLDYGADGISLYDPPEKIIPHWKGPPAEKIPDFLNDFLEQRKKNSTSKIEPVKNDENGSAKKSAAVLSHENVKDYLATRDSVKIDDKNQINPKTVVEGSDGSVKAGKKSGKEFWQHTKKWSQGFLESYNAETDPEVKSAMKDIGKDLDRWITEKEIKEAAEVMNRIHDKNKSILEKKLNKVKREMELFGPQAVVSKYREYADEEEDYLWWLDLPYVLCIELYTIDGGEQRVGFYTLEMARDLEVEPKPHHVIAFQDAGDCKSLCYIIQAHLEMLGNGQAFVVAQHPKDAFREAKANGFGVTVIKKGELKLNIDQPLEEVEEEITEIGSKMYHDMIMKERSVDINSLMKGVFGFSDRSKKRLKRNMRKPRK